MDAKLGILETIEESDLFAETPMPARALHVSIGWTSVSQSRRTEGNPGGIGESPRVSPSKGT